jgi:hypothetical protein
MARGHAMNEDLALVIISGFVAIVIMAIMLVVGIQHP